MHYLLWLSYRHEYSNVGYSKAQNKIYNSSPITLSEIPTFCRLRQQFTYGSGPSRPAGVGSGTYRGCRGGIWVWRRVRTPLPSVRHPTRAGRYVHRSHAPLPTQHRTPYRQHDLAAIRSRKRDTTNIYIFHTRNLCSYLDNNLSIPDLIIPHLILF